MSRCRLIISFAMVLSLQIHRSTNAQPIITEFDAGPDGWLYQDMGVDGPAGRLLIPPVILSSFPAAWSGSGGNPGGNVSGVDNSGNWWVFAAPAAYLGDKSAYCGGSLALDVRTDTSAPTDGLVILWGAGLLLYYNGEQTVGTTWTHFDVPLVASSRWRVNDWHASSPQATQSQIAAALSSLDALYITGDLRSGFETTWLDNVAMSAATGPRGDIDGNGVVDSDDVLVFVAVLLSADADPVHVARSDLNCDGIVDGLDVQPFVTAIISS